MHVWMYVKAFCMSLCAFSVGKNGGINASMLANNCCHVKYVEHSTVALRFVGFWKGNNMKICIKLKWKKQATIGK